MVIPPVVVSADVPDRAVITAAVLIEAAMMPERDTGEILFEPCAKGGGRNHRRQACCARFLRERAFPRV